MKIEPEIILPPASEARITVSVEWQESGRPEDFRFPRIFTHLTTKDVNHPKRNKTYSTSTHGHAQLNDALTQLYSETIHVAQRPFLNKRIFDQWQAISTSVKYQRCLKEFNDLISSERRRNGGQQVAEMVSKACYKS